MVIIGLPLVARPTQPLSYVFTQFKMSPKSTGVTSKPYAVIMSALLSNYSLYGYDTAAHLTEETKGADKTGPVAILSSIGIISVFGGAYYLALTFSIKVGSFNSKYKQKLSLCVFVRLNQVHFSNNVISRLSYI